MSGLELVGVAASILQIAEIGGQLSIKLCTFCHKVKNADRNLQNLSHDVALTSNVLRHLGDSLEQDKQGQLYSKHALATAQDVLGECKKVFEEIGDAIDCVDGKSTKDKVNRMVTRIGFVLREPQLDVLKSNLERLKSTMLLMLNVIMYAGQIQSRLDSNILEEQRELIQTLMHEKKSTDERFRELKKSLEPSITMDDYASQPRNPGSPTISLSTIGTSLPVQPGDDLEKYVQLITKILSDIDACKSDLEGTRYRRISSSAWDIHFAEIEHFETTHGRSASEWLQDQVLKARREAIGHHFRRGAVEGMFTSRHMERAPNRHSISYDAGRRSQSSFTNEYCNDESQLHHIERDSANSSDNYRRSSLRARLGRDRSPEPLDEDFRQLLDNEYYDFQRRIDTRDWARRRRSYTCSRPSTSRHATTNLPSDITGVAPDSDKASGSIPFQTIVGRAGSSRYQDYSGSDADSFNDSSSDAYSIERYYRGSIGPRKPIYNRNRAKRKSKPRSPNARSQTRKHDPERQSSDYLVLVEQRRRRNTLVRRKRALSSDESNSGPSLNETGRTRPQHTSPAVHTDDYYAEPPIEPPSAAVESIPVSSGPSREYRPAGLRFNKKRKANFNAEDQQTEASVEKEIPEADALVLEWTTLKKDDISV